MGRYEDLRAKLMYDPPLLASDECRTLERLMKVRWEVLLKSMPYGDAVETSRLTVDLARLWWWEGELHLRARLMGRREWVERVIRCIMD